MAKEEKVAYTTIVNKYPTFRGDKINGCWRWLEGRRADDNAEGLWRVHDKLYDLTDFVEKHPGGSLWLTLTKVIKS
jgi:Cytochrome b5-like Heme/Steroid binding domain